MKTKALALIQQRSFQWFVLLSAVAVSAYVAVSLVSQQILAYASASLFPAYLAVLGL